jgi:hypothetical protein
MIPRKSKCSTNSYIVHSILVAVVVAHCKVIILEQQGKPLVNNEWQEV